MMRSFPFHADLDDPAQLVSAVRSVFGVDDIVIVEEDGTYEKDPPREAAITIEWHRRTGRFGLDVTVRGEDARPHDTDAQLARAIAKVLDRALLFSDCSAFPFSYFMANPDGAIWYVVIRIGEDDIMDLEEVSPDNPNSFVPRLVFRADEPMPEHLHGTPTAWTHGETACETRVEGKPCRVFNMPCPKRRLIDAEAPPA